MHRDSTPEITELLVKAVEKARRETREEPEPLVAREETWPVEATIGPGLEGAIACYTSIGHVNGSKGVLTYAGHNVFDLAIHSTYEETAYLLIHGKLPTPKQLERFKAKLAEFRHIPRTLRLLQSFPVENINPMGALRLGVNLMRRVQTTSEAEVEHPESVETIRADDDSIPEETQPMGYSTAVYETDEDPDAGLEDTYHLISGMATLTAAIGRLRKGRLPIEPDPELSHAGNFLYMLSGKRPTPAEERIMDICLILHADHGMNASTFASMVVASTLSDIYFSVGSGVAALNGPLHGGANEQVLYTLEEIMRSGDVKAWYEKARANKKKIMGFGHRVYKTYDPRARILGPLADLLSKRDKDGIRPLLKVAKELEKEVVRTLGSKKGIFPNVDFYSGLVYKALGIETSLFTPVFAVSRVAGWSARCLEYLRKNRIFRPRAIYMGRFDSEYRPIAERARGGGSKAKK